MKEIGDGDATSITRLKCLLWLRLAHIVLDDRDANIRTFAAYIEMKERAVRLSWRLGRLPTKTRWLNPGGIFPNPQRGLTRLASARIRLPASRVEVEGPAQFKSARSDHSTQLPLLDNRLQRHGLYQKTLQIATA